MIQLADIRICSSCGLIDTDLLEGHCIHCWQDQAAMWRVIASSLGNSYDEARAAQQPSAEELTGAMVYGWQSEDKQQEDKLGAEH